MMDSTTATFTGFRSLCTWLGCVAASALAAGCSGGGGGGTTQVAGVDAVETAVLMGEYAVNGVEPLLDLNSSEAATLEAQMGPLTFSSRVLRNLRLNKLLARQASARGVAVGVLVDQTACPAGGWTRVYCDSDATTGTVRMVSDHCTEDNGGTLEQSNGALTMVVDDPLVCDNGMMDYGNMTVRCDNLSETESVGGELVSSFRMNGIVSMSEGPDVGCSFTGGSISANIRLDLLSLEDGMDATLTASNLQVTDDVTAGTCAELITINGTLGLEDRVDGEAVRQTFSNFQIGIQEEVGSTLVTLDGQATARCVGAVTFDTLEPLSIPTDADCPTAGLLQVTVARTLETATVRFNPDGSVDIDLGVDGTIDLSRASCNDLTTHGSCY